MSKIRKGNGHTYRVKTRSVKPKVSTLNKEERCDFGKGKRRDFHEDYGTMCAVNGMYVGDDQTLVPFCPRYRICTDLEGGPNYINNVSHR